MMTLIGIKVGMDIHITHKSLITSKDNQISSPTGIVVKAEAEGMLSRAEGLLDEKTNKT